jgi:nucleotide-binding universal stress UspA family protein
MFHSLLVPVDGSTFGEHALPLALSIARRAGATVQLAHVHVPYALMYVDSMPPGALEGDARAEEQSRAYLDSLVKRLESVAVVPVTATLLEGTQEAEVLRAHATATGVDLIVMTTHGRGPLSRLLLGSVADRLVREVSIPVLLVRPHEAAPDLAIEPVLRHILVPLDGSGLAERVLEPVVALGTLMQADYRLLRVYGPLVDTHLDPLAYAMVGGFEPPPEELKAQAQPYLDGVADRLRARGLSVETHAVAGWHAAAAILDESTSRPVDLIAIATHGYHGLTRLLSGSVADKVLRRTNVAVLVQHSDGK